MSKADLDPQQPAQVPRALLGRIAAPATRIVSLTVTEKGYCHDPATGTYRCRNGYAATRLTAEPTTSD